MDCFIKATLHSGFSEHQGAVSFATMSYVIFGLVQTYLLGLSILALKLPLVKVKYTSLAY